MDNIDRYEILDEPDERGHGGVDEKGKEGGKGAEGAEG